MHPTLAGLYPFLLGSPARCAFLSYLCLYLCLGSPARSQLSCSTFALTEPIQLGVDINGRMLDGILFNMLRLGSESTEVGEVCHMSCELREPVFKAEIWPNFCSYPQQPYPCLHSSSVSCSLLFLVLSRRCTFSWFWIQACLGDW